MKAICKICGKSYRYLFAKHSKLPSKCPACKKKSERKRIKLAYERSKRTARRRFYDPLGNKLPYYLRD